MPDRGDVLGEQPLDVGEAVGGYRARVDQTPGTRGDRGLEDVPRPLDVDVPGLVAGLEDDEGEVHDDVSALDEAFHQGLLQLSGHARSWSTVVAAKGHLDRARRLGLTQTPPAPFAAQHVEIFQAVLDQDVPRARNTMRRHLRAVFEDIEQIRARSPELFSDSQSVPVRRNVVVWQ